MGFNENGCDKDGFDKKGYENGFKDKELINIGFYNAINKDLKFLCDK